MASTTVQPAATVMPCQITSDYVSAETPDPEYPDDSSDLESSPSPDDPQGRRKRKSWGQAIPEYETLLPPGKRAKTEAEKEQRRCERIMRNRRAAATSRDRKKREFEDMEKRVEEKDSEIAWIRAQAQANMERILAIAFPDGKIPATLAGIDMNLSRPASSLPPTPAYSPIDEQSEPHVVRHSSPAMSVLSLSNKDHSQTLAGPLFMKKEESELDSLYSHNTPESLDDIPNLLNNSDKVDDLVNSAMNNPSPFLDVFANIENSGLTQYPAEVLCVDQQCQPESPMLASRLNTKWVNSILVIQLMVANAMSGFSSTKMTWLMSQILNSLERIWPQALTSTEMMDMILPLIHSLIFLPSKETTSPRAFRMAFLRKLLSYSPASARHFDDATSRALRRLSSAEAIIESQRGGISWSSLMTLRLVIKNIEGEKMAHRDRLKLSTSSRTMDVGARSSGKLAFNGAMGSMGSFHSPGDRGTCTPGPVHY